MTEKKQTGTEKQTQGTHDEAPVGEADWSEVERVMKRMLDTPPKPHDAQRVGRKTTRDPKAD